MPGALTGVIASWNEAKGFGFVSREDEYDTFVHAGALADEGAKPARGDRVTFELSDGRDGRPRAANVAIEASGCDVPEGKGRLPRAPQQGGGGWATGNITRVNIKGNHYIVTDSAPPGRTALIPFSLLEEGERYQRGDKVRYRAEVGSNSRLHAVKVAKLGGGRAAGGRSAGGRSADRGGSGQHGRGAAQVPLAPLGQFGGGVNTSSLDMQMLQQTMFADADGEAAQALIAGFRRRALLTMGAQMQARQMT
eukprot:gene57032-biopygen80433